MSLFHSTLTGLALLCAATSPALAASSAASSASESSAASSGSVSESLTGSSGSSSKTTQVAQGDYRVVALAEVAERPGMVRVQLQAVNAVPAGAEREFQLLLPRQAALTGRLAEGGLVTASERPYGIEFASAATEQAFFLVLADGWQRELQTRVVAI